MPIDISNFSKPEVDPASVVGGVGGNSPLTGNGADDVFALSAGTGQKLTLSGVSPAASLAAPVLGNVLTYGPGGASAPDGSYTLLSTATQRVGDGTATTLAAVYSTLAAAQAVYPFITALTQTVDYAAMQLAINTVALDASAPAGGTLFVPHGTYAMGSVQTSVLLVPFNNTNVPFTLRGNNGGRSQPTVGATSKIRWSTDAAAGTAPHTVYGLDGASCDALTVRDISFQGPSRFSFNSGRLPCCMGAIRAIASSALDNVSFEQFSTAYGMGGGTVAGFRNTKGFDHSSIYRFYCNNVGYGIHWLPGSNTAGDQRLYDLQIHANCAAFAVAASASSGLVGTNITGAGLYAPISVFLYDDDTHAGATVLGNEWENASCELAFNASFFGQRLTNPGGSTFAKNVMNYFFQGPHISLPGWSSPAGFTVTAAPAGPTGNQITISDNNGNQWELGMAVTGTNIGAGAVITAVNGVTTNQGVRAGWPYNNPTLTLSVNCAADPTGNSVGILIPKLGNIVAFNIHDNVANSFSQGYPPYPAYYVPSAGIINDNTCADVNQTLNAALSNAQTSGPTNGTTWGQVGASCFIGSGRMAAATPCTAGDLLMFDTLGNRLVLCDNTRPPVGAAILTTAAGGNVDYYISAANPNLATIRNKTAGTILANALLKADGANPGGVATASGPNDGFIVGFNDTVAITAGTSATIAQLQC